MNYSNISELIVTEYTFAGRLAILLGTDMFLAIVNTYIPHELSPIRVLVAGIQLTFMLVTMLVTLQWLVEDF